MNRTHTHTHDVWYSLLSQMGRFGARQAGERVRARSDEIRRVACAKAAGFLNWELTLADRARGDCCSGQHQHVIRRPIARAVAEASLFCCPACRRIINYNGYIYIIYGRTCTHHLTFVLLLCGSISFSAHLFTRSSSMRMQLKVN